MYITGYFPCPEITVYRSLEDAKKDYPNVMPPYGAKAFVKHEGEGLIVVFICLDDDEVTQGDLGGLIAHESVHIAERWCEFLGEDDPGEEVFAYMVQASFLTLVKSIEDVWTKKN